MSQPDKYRLKAREVLNGYSWRPEMHPAYSLEDDIHDALAESAREAMERAAKERGSLIRSLQEIIAYRYELRQICLALLKYAEDTYPRNPISSRRELEEADRRKQIIANAKRVLFETAQGDAEAIRKELS